ncbi:MAG: phosphatase PAP2 family protein [Gemmatimonadaceae bacterium]
MNDSHQVSKALRSTIARADNVIGGLGIFLVSGVVIAVILTLGFGEFAETVMAGKTQAFDESVLQWMGAHHTGLLDGAMLEITALGTGTVVLMIVCISALFLALTRHRYSALLLVVATAGGLLLNLALKLFFDRPRPHIIVWGTNAVSSSFPSGHAMSATIVYSTVAYLAARLFHRAWQRWLTMIFAMIVIILISLSRLYLGVHYPSDVVAGAVIGLAWAAFCMATLEGIQRLATRHQPDIQRHEEPAPEASS